MRLTRQERHLLQLLLPGLTHNDLLASLEVTVNSVALVLGIIDKLRNVTGPQRLQDVEHVGPVGLSFRHVWVLVGEVLHEQLILLDQGPDLLDGQLIKLGDLDCAEISQLEQLLLLHEDQLEIILVDHVFGWEVQLDYSKSERESD